MKAHRPVAVALAEEYLREDCFMTDDEEAQDGAIGALSTECLRTPHELVAAGVLHRSALRLRKIQIGRSKIEPVCGCPAIHLSNHQRPRFTGGSCLFGHPSDGGTACLVPRQTG